MELQGGKYVPLLLITLWQWSVYGAYLCIHSATDIGKCHRFMSKFVDIDFESGVV